MKKSTMALTFCVLQLGASAAFADLFRCQNALPAHDIEQVHVLTRVDASEIIPDEVELFVRSSAEGKILKATKPDDSTLLGLIDDPHERVAGERYTVPYGTLAFVIYLETPGDTRATVKLVDPKKPAGKRFIGYVSDTWGCAKVVPVEWPADLLSGSGPLKK